MYSHYKTTVTGGLLSAAAFMLLMALESPITPRGRVFLQKGQMIFCARTEIGTTPKV